jgi:hypothetical protein
MSFRMDDGRSVQLDPAQHPHLDHGLCRDQPFQPGADRRACAHTPQHTQEQSIQPPQQEIAPKQEHSYGLGLGL